MRFRIIQTNDDYVHLPDATNSVVEGALREVRRDHLVIRFLDGSDLKIHIAGGSRIRHLKPHIGDLVRIHITKINENVVLAGPEALENVFVLPVR